MHEKQVDSMDHEEPLKNKRVPDKVQMYFPFLHIVFTLCRIPVEFFGKHIKDNLERLNFINSIEVVHGRSFFSIVALSDGYTACTIERTMYS